MMIFAILGIWESGILGPGNLQNPGFSGTPPWDLPWRPVTPRDRPQKNVKNLTWERGESDAPFSHKKNSNQKIHLLKAPRGPWWGDSIYFRPRDFSWEENF